MATTSVDIEQVRRRWAERGFSCDVWIDAPGQEWRDFLHATEELVMPIEGQIELEFGGQTFRPQVGEEILIPARTRHTVRNIGRTLARWLYGYKVQ
ncbi:MAG: cupin domain-containing protein [Candidatus Binatia bacterium]|nr:cupin domain-containing protein [Candidatus Binatia bacterium]